MNIDCSEGMAIDELRGSYANVEGYGGAGYRDSTGDWAHQVGNVLSKDVYRVRYSEYPLLPVPAEGRCCGR